MSRELKIVKLEIMQSQPNDPKPNSRNRPSKVPYMVRCSPQVANFHPFHSTISLFQDIAHYRIFPLTPMLKFQSATIFFNFWQIANKNFSATIF